MEEILNDQVWESLRGVLPPEKGQRGAPRSPNRPIVEAILYKHMTGTPWRELPRELGPWITVINRFTRWRKEGLWRKVLEVLASDSRYAWARTDGLFGPVDERDDPRCR